MALGQPTPQASHIMATCEPGANQRPPELAHILATVHFYSSGLDRAQTLLTCGHGMTCLWLRSCKHDWPLLHVVCRPDEHVWFGPGQFLLSGIKLQSWSWWITMKYGIYISHMMSQMNCHVTLINRLFCLAPSSGKNVSNTSFSNHIPAKQMAFLLFFMLISWWQRE